MGETSWSRISLTVSTLLICKRLAYRKAMSFHHRRHMGDFDEGNIAIIKNDPGLDNAAGLIYTHTSTANSADSPKKFLIVQCKWPPRKNTEVAWWHGRKSLEHVCNFTIANPENKYYCCLRQCVT